MTNKLCFGGYATASSPSFSRMLYLRNCLKIDGKLILNALNEYIKPRTREIKDIIFKNHIHLQSQLLIYLCQKKY